MNGVREVEVHLAEKRKVAIIDRASATLATNALLTSVCTYSDTLFISMVMFPKFSMVRVSCTGLYPTVIVKLLRMRLADGYM